MLLNFTIMDLYYGLVLYLYICICPPCILTCCFLYLLAVDAMTPGYMSLLTCCFLYLLAVDAMTPQYMNQFSSSTQTPNPTVT